MLNIIRRWTVTRITRFRALRCEPSIHKNARQFGTNPDGGEVSLSSILAVVRLVKFLWPLLAGNPLEPLCWPPTWQAPPVSAGRRRSRQVGGQHNEDIVQRRCAPVFAVARAHGGGVGVGFPVAYHQHIGDFL